MIKMNVVNEEKEYSTIAEIAEKLISDIENVMENVYYFSGLDDAEEEEIQELNEELGNLLEACDECIYYKYDFDFLYYEYMDGKLYTFYDGRLTSLEDILEALEKTSKTFRDLLTSFK